MELELDRCTIRSWRLTDAQALVRHADNRKVWQNLRDSFPHPYKERDADDWIDLVSRVEPETNFAIEVDGEAAGGIGLELKTDVYRCSAEIGYWLGEPFWGRGIATEAVGAMTEWGFENLDLTRIYASVFSHNPASMRVLEKAGFVHEATLKDAVCKEGKVLDEHVFATWPD